jgi:integrase
MPRRQFGSIRRLPSGRYQARYRNPAGHFVTAPRTFRTKAAAGLFLSTIEADLARGDWQDPRLARKTVREWADQWTATMTVRANTRRGYETALRTHVLPAFGDREVRTVTASDVARFVADMLAGGSAPGTVSGAKKVLRLVLNEAVRSDAIRRNPCDAVKVPRSRSDEMMFLSIGQVFDLAEAITHPAITRRTGGQDSYPEYGLLVRFAAFTGLRAGEIGALRVGRVDAGRRRVEVAEAVTEVSAELAPGGLIYDDPKTYERRTVPLVA